MPLLYIVATLYMDTGDRIRRLFIVARAEHVSFFTTLGAYKYPLFWRATMNKSRK
jgi:hypothetical protein